MATGLMPVVLRQQDFLPDPLSMEKLSMEKKIAHQHLKTRRLSCGKTKHFRSWDICDL